MTDDVSSKMDGLSGRLDRLEKLLLSRFEQADQDAQMTEQLELQEMWRQKQGSSPAKSQESAAAAAASYPR